MTSLSRTLLAVAGIVFSAQVAAQATFYENPGFTGRTVRANQEITRFDRYSFNDRTSSVVIVGNRWEVCEHSGFQGRCVVLRPGKYPSLADMGLNDEVSSARAIARNARVDDDRYAPGPVVVAPQVTFYERERFDGRSFTTTGAIPNFRRYGFNDRASSAVVVGERWEVCDDNRYRGRCVVLRPGRYPSLEAMGMNDRISSVRTVEGNGRIDNNRYAPQPVAVYDSRRRNNERLFEAPVTSVRAVLATSGQRCWVEREQVQGQGGNANVPGALAGALIGGILGHQVGNGSGQDIATVGGVVAGAALGSQEGQGGQAATQDVQRCENIPGGAQPAYWDVSYNFRGRDHRVQMTTAPGQTVSVNDQGEPRERE